MQYLVRYRWIWPGLLLLPWLALGCAEGPFCGAMLSVSPWARKQWAEDEKYGPTFHRRIAELRAVRESVAKFAEPRKEQLAAEMAELVRTDPNPILRSEALAVLGELGGSTAAATLNAAIVDQDKDVRIAACRALSRIHTEDAMAALSRVAESDADVDVRLAAIGELATFKDPRAVQSLGQALEDNDPAIQFQAVQSLKVATGREELGDSVPAWRDFVQGKVPETRPQPSIVQRLYQLF